MGNECVGSLSPQADLLGFAVAILLATALAMMISDRVTKDGMVADQDITVDDLRAILEWPGFDPDLDGVLSAPRMGVPEASTGTGTQGRVVASLCHDGDETSFLFIDGGFYGEIPREAPISRIISVNVLLEHEGITVPGTLSVFRAGGAT
jgi:hypothetical protein